jgi:hypothetical protein
MDIEANRHFRIVAAWRISSHVGAAWSSVA